MFLSSQDRCVFLSSNNSCALLPRVLESLLVSLVTTVVVFVASMVLGECRQMSASSQVGNDSFLLQVTPVHLLPLSCTHTKNSEMYDMSLCQANACIVFKREERVVSFLPEKGGAPSVCHFCEQSWLSQRGHSPTPLPVEQN